MSFGSYVTVVFARRMLLLPELRELHRLLEALGITATLRNSDAERAQSQQDATGIAVRCPMAACPPISAAASIILR